MGNRGLDRVKELFIIEGDKIPFSGKIPVNLNVDREKWKGCKIVQHGSEFRIHESVKDGFIITITIDAEDALYLIETLKLAATLCPIMNRVVIWVPNE